MCRAWLMADSGLTDSGRRTNSAHCDLAHRATLREMDFGRALLLVLAALFTLAYLRRPGDGVARTAEAPRALDLDLDAGTAAPAGLDDHAGNPFWPWLDSYKTGPGIHKHDQYIGPYHRHFAQFRGRKVVMAEVGVQSGGSIEMWRDYFGAANLEWVSRRRDSGLGRRDSGGATRTQQFLPISPPVSRPK